LVYRQLSVKALWDGGTTWNREHVWPQSLLGVDTSNTSRHKGADLHNLKPANPSENSSRSNKYFAETTTSKSYAPPAVVLGDIARIMFYMVTMYPELSLIDLTPSSSTPEPEPATFQMAQFSLFVKWHLEDPVDTFESNRNQVLYQYQGNRNPFIDREELVCRMFRQQTTAATSYCAQA
jgi:endonuclease I